MKTLTWQKPGQQNVAQELIKIIINYVAELRQYRLLAFWDKVNGTDTLVIATHGFIKKTQKTPPKEIAKAEEIRTRYFNAKDK